jgi:beta-glucosidase
MSNIFKSLVIRVMVLFVLLNAIGFSAIAQKKGVEQKIDSIISLMTLEEKVGQLTQVSGEFDKTGPVSPKGNLAEDIVKGAVGSMLSYYGAKVTYNAQKLAVEKSRLHIPLLFCYDVVHGFKTTFPVPIAEASSWDPLAVEQTARIAATEASSSGIQCTFAPMIDVALDPRWGRIMEGNGEDPYLCSCLAAAKVRGYQENLNSFQDIVSCPKHFVAYGAAEGGRDYNTVDVSERRLREVYLPPFKAAFDAGALMVMSAFDDINGVPATANEFTLQQILKKEWGFQGFVVTDYNSIGELVNHGIAADHAQAAELAIKAGVDMDMMGYVYREELPALVKSGKIPIALVDEAVRRVLRVKFRLGLFDDPYKYCDQEREKNTLLRKDFLEASRNMAQKSIVLLKNENQLLPLKKNIRTIALIGPQSLPKDIIGNWAGAGEVSIATSLYEGIKAKVSANTRILVAKGCNINDDSLQNIKEAVKVARKADVVILAIGEHAMMSGESLSRSSLDLPGVQLDLVKAIYETKKPIIVVLMNGRPLAIPWLDKHIPSILETWFLGTKGGDAIADVIFGDYNPSGKLPASFPITTGQIPVYYFHKNTGRPYTPDCYFCSRYIDNAVEPLYPFGFGLSYTSFEYSPVKLNKSSLLPNDTLIASVDIKNIGNYDGSEVAQLYIQDLFGSVTRPVKELKSFEKIFLKKGESKTVDFRITANDLRFYTKDMTFKAEPGSFKVFVGTNSRQVSEALFQYKE